MTTKIALAKWQYIHPDVWILDAEGYRGVVKLIDGEYTANIKQFKAHTYQVVQELKASPLKRVAMRRCRQWIEQVVDVVTS